MVLKLHSEHSIRVVVKFEFAEYIKAQVVECNAAKDTKHSNRIVDRGNDEYFEICDDINQSVDQHSCFPKPTCTT